MVLIPEKFLYLQNIDGKPTMGYFIFTQLPLFVVLFWLILFLLDGQKESAKRFLTLFLCVVLVNYITHWFYFNHIYLSFGLSSLLLLSPFAYHRYQNQ